MDSAQLILAPARGGCGETNDITGDRSRWKIVAQDSGGEDQVVKATIRLGARVGSRPIRFRRPELYGEILNERK